MKKKVGRISLVEIFQPRESFLTRIQKHLIKPDAKRKSLLLTTRNDHSIHIMPCIFRSCDYPKNDNYKHLIKFDENSNWNYYSREDNDSEKITLKFVETP
jgi:hypothetical protein